MAFEWGEALRNRNNEKFFIDKNLDDDKNEYFFFYFKSD